MTSKKKGVTNGNGYTPTIIIIRKGRYTGMTREQFENNTNWKMTFEEFQKCDCTHCDKKDCIHRNAFRRVPGIDGGLGLCPNLKDS